MGDYEGRLVQELVGLNKLRQRGIKARSGEIERGEDREC